MNMILSPTDFLYSGVLFLQDPINGRCYRLAEPTSQHGRAARLGLLVLKRVSLAHYNKNLAACQAVTL
jgi:hypothetical protein